MRREAKEEAKRSKALFALEIEFGRQGREVHRETIIQKYIDNPYMQRYVDGKINKTLAEVVYAIDSGEASCLEEKAVKNGVKQRE